MLVAHIAAALTIFVFSLIKKNSSFFDAYWSVIPIPTVLWFGGLADLANWGPRRWLIVALVSLWGCRLSYNWWRGWTGFDHEDWRYVELREQHGALYPLVNLFGIHLFPCALVFGGCVPLWVAMGSSEFVALDLLAAAVTLGAIVIEATADRQLWSWRQSKPPREAYMTTGLWRLSRHPNYFGEVSFWWGLWLFAMAVSSEHAWMVVGALAMTGLFVFISIPMMERRTLAKRPHYAEHMAKTSMLVPWPPRAG